MNPSLPPASPATTENPLHKAHLTRIHIIKPAELDPMKHYEPLKIQGQHRKIMAEAKATKANTTNLIASGKVETGLTYSDVLLEPVSQSRATSRFDPKFDTSSLLTKNLVVPNPLIPANMMTVFSEELLRTLIASNPEIVLIADRFPKSLCGNHKDHPITELSSEWQRAISERLAIAPKNLIQSLGVDAFKREPEKYLAQIQAIASVGVAGFCIDIAHGSNQCALSLLKEIKKVLPDTNVIVGNIATVQEYLDCVKAGADAVKVGIGPGAMCSTRAIAGVGFPQLSALARIWPARLLKGVPVIADGGIQCPGDVSKALVFADTVMIGGEFAKAKESGAFTVPELIEIDKRFEPRSRAQQIIEAKIKECPDPAHYKLYAGQASEFFQLIYNGVLREGVTPEGEARWRECPRGIVEIYNEYLTALASSLSYRDSYSIGEARPKSVFIGVSAGGGHRENSVR